MYNSQPVREEGALTFDSGRYYWLTTCFTSLLTLLWLLLTLICLSFCWLIGPATYICNNSITVSDRRLRPRPLYRGEQPLGKDRPAVDIYV